MTITSTDATPAQPIDLQLIGGPTLLLTIAGLTVLTDPTFDPPGDHPVGQRVLVKLAGPAVEADQLPPIDLVLLSHEQHPDNLDDVGRDVTRRAGVVVTTQQSAEKLGGDNTVALVAWRSHTVVRPDGKELRITAVPAQHGPRDVEHLSGHVLGFVLSAPDIPTTYVSGDNASLDVVAEVAQHAGPIELAILFGGRARSPLMDAYLTLSAEQLVSAARILGASTVVPVHLDGWGHLTEGPAEVRAAFDAVEHSGAVHLLAPGERLTVESRAQQAAGH